MKQNDLIEGHLVPELSTEKPHIFIKNYIVFDQEYHIVLDVVSKIFKAYLSTNYNEIIETSGTYAQLCKLLNKMTPPQYDDMYMSLDLALPYHTKIKLFTVTGSIIRSSYSYSNLHNIDNQRQFLIHTLDMARTWRAGYTLPSDYLIRIPSNLKISLDIANWILDQINPLLVKYIALYKKYENEVRNTYEEHMISLQLK